MIRIEDNLKYSVLPFLIHPLSEPREQVQFCQNLIANLFEKGDSPSTKEFPDIQIGRQFLDHYFKTIVVSHHNMESTQLKSDHQCISRQISHSN